MNLNIGWQLKIRDRVWKDVAKFPKKIRKELRMLLKRKLVLTLTLATLRK